MILGHPRVFAPFPGTITMGYVVVIGGWRVVLSYVSFGVEGEEVVR